MNYSKATSGFSFMILWFFGFYWYFKGQKFKFSLHLPILPFLLEGEIQNSSWVNALCATTRFSVHGSYHCLCKKNIYFTSYRLQLPIKKVYRQRLTIFFYWLPLKRLSSRLPDKSIKECCVTQLFKLKFCFNKDKNFHRYKVRGENSLRFLLD